VWTGAVLRPRRDAGHGEQARRCVQRACAAQSGWLGLLRAGRRLSHTLHHHLVNQSKVFCLRARGGAHARGSYGQKGLGLARRQAPRRHRMHALRTCSGERKWSRSCAPRIASSACPVWSAYLPRVRARPGERAVVIESRRVGAMREGGRAARGAHSLTRRSRISRISRAWISMSLAWPETPPDGWWIMMRELGSARRILGSPPARRSAAIEQHWPTHSVATGDVTNCMVYGHSHAHPAQLLGASHGAGGRGAAGAHGLRARARAAKSARRKSRVRR
jgi:hypothetical protein